METYQSIMMPVLWAWGLFCLAMYIDTFVRYINAFINDDETFRANIILQKVDKDFLRVPAKGFKEFELITVLFICAWVLGTMYLMMAIITVPVTIAVRSVLYARNKKRKEREDAA